MVQVCIRNGSGMYQEWFRNVTGMYQEPIVAQKMRTSYSPWGTSHGPHWAPTGPPPGPHWAPTGRASCVYVSSAKPTISLPRTGGERPFFKD